MKTLLTMLLFCLAAQGTTLAQNWFPAGMPSQSWTAIAASADASTWVAVSSSGSSISPATMYVSTNSGVNWQQSIAPSLSWKCAACSADGHTMMAAGSGFLYESSDAGSTWTLNSVPAHNWGSLASSSDGTVRMAGPSGGYLYVSTNSGATWQTNLLSGAYRFVSCSPQGNVLMTVGGPSGNAVYFSTNSGDAWWQSTNAPVQTWSSMTAGTNGNILMMTAGALLYMTTNRGDSWFSNSLPTTSSGFVACSGNGEKIVFTRYNATYTSTNLGVTWITNNTPNSNINWTYAGVAADGSKMAAVGNNQIYLLPMGPLTKGTVLAWDVNNYGQAMVPLEVGPAQAIAASRYDSLAVRTNGTVLAWGLNDLMETNVPEGLSNVATVAASQQLSLALKSDGTLAWWGSSTYTNIIPSLSNITAVAASQGDFYSALRSDGKVVSWGANGYGQTNVPGGLSNVVAIAEGDSHCLALKGDGTLVGWGGNVKGTYGQATIPSGLSNVVAIAAGDYYSLALKRDGTIVGFPTNNVNVVMRIPAGLSNVVAIAANGQHALGLTEDGFVHEWGTVGSGYLDYQVGLSNVVAIACGTYHCLAMAGDGSPAVVRQPWDQTVYAGESVTMGAGVVGASPLAFQWQLNGTNVDGATNAMLDLVDAQPSDAGNYSLLVTNSLGVTTSAIAALTIIAKPPVISLQPTNQTVLAGSDVTFTTGVNSGPGSIAYQWQFNGTNMDQATSADLLLTNVQVANQGNYDVVASNAFGFVVSSNAFLTVVPRDVAHALSTTNLEWLNSTQPAWFVESTNTHDGFAAVAAGPLASGQQSVLQTYVDGPGTLSFWWASSMNLAITFSVDGISKASWLQYYPSVWGHYTFYVAAGEHLLTWTAGTQGYLSYPGMAFLDDVSFTPGATPVQITTQPMSQTNAAGNNVTFSVGSIGTPPMTYQWFFNGAAVAGATGALLTLNNVQADNAGNYYVAVDNGYGSAVSSNATLTVIPSAPVITTQPAGAPAIIGSQMIFNGAAIGSSPIHYQWCLNDVPILGATNTSLSVSNIQYSDGGDYSLVASNIIGTTTSSNAFLYVYSDADLGATLDASAIAWSTTNVPWFPETNTTYDGVSAAQSGAISGSQQSTLQGVVTGPATITYWWKVNCDSFWMSLAFVLNGSVQNSITGNVDWKQATNYIGAGTQVLQWNLYPVHGAFAGGTGWVDQVQVIPGGTPVNIVSNPTGSTNNAGDNVTFSVSATGTPPLLYQWRINGVSLPDATNAMLSLNNVQTNNAGIYSVAVTNDFGWAISSNVMLMVNSSAPMITSQPAGQSKAVNGSVTFSATAKGSNPLAYQWQFNGSPIAGAVSNVLSLASLQMSDAGNYTVVVTNDFGSVTSSVAVLTVSPMLVVDCWPYYSSSSISAPSGLSNITAIAVGEAHTLALRRDGIVLAWGDNSYGQTNVPAGLSNVVAIAAGASTSTALKSDGTVVIWGNHSPSEFQTVASLSNVVAIAAGPVDTFALKNDGTVVGWGNDAYGQIEIPADITNAQAIAAGYYNGFAVNADGTVSQWGNGPVWQHNGTNTQLSVAAGMSDAVAIAAGGLSAWSLRSDGFVDSWGWDASMPVANPGTVVALAAGAAGSPISDYLLELNSDGTVYGGSRYPSSTSIPVIPAGLSNVVAVAAAYGHAALLINDGAPQLVGQMLNKTVFTGATVKFAAGFVGAGPLQYQWQFNGTNLDHATNAFLLLTNVPLSAAGDYRCISTNSYGAATNLNVALTVLRSIAQFDTSASTLGFKDGGFNWELDHLSGHGPIVVYASSNLVNWVPIFTNPPQLGSFQFLDADATNQPARFYRAVEQ